MKIPVLPRFKSVDDNQIFWKSILAQSNQFLSCCCSFKPVWTLLGKGLKPLSNLWFGQSCCYASSVKHSSNSENEAMLPLSYHLKCTSVLQVFEDCWRLQNEPCNILPMLESALNLMGFSSSAELEVSSPLAIYSSQWHYWNSNSNLYTITGCPQMRR